MTTIQKEIAHILEELRREVRTFVEVSGVKGVSEFRSVYWAPVGGAHNPKAAENAAKAERMIEKLGAIPETVRALKPLLEESQATRMVIDKTHSQEEEDRRIAARLAEQAAADLGKIRRVEAGNRARANVPKWARAAIIAELHVSDCDGMTDYFASHVERRLLIGWRSGKRDDFQQMRIAAAGQLETQHLNDRKHEHREKYSFGHGYYLGEARYSGWQVRAVHMGRLDDFDFEDRIPAPPKMHPMDGILVRENDPRDGVEIIFPWMPNASTRDALKNTGFRWSRAQKLWYARRSEQTVAFAHDLAARPEQEVKQGEEA